MRLKQDASSLQRETQMLEQSVAGLAAKTVNEQRGDELVWIENGNVDGHDWLARTLARHPQLEMRGEFHVWDLVDRYAKNGTIQGYILYRADDSKGEINQHRTGMDCSVNVATSLAGIHDAVIVDEKLEPAARAHGLKLLVDARDKSQKWCFEHYRDRFNRGMICTQDPRKPHVRDLAIAQNAFTVYGDEEPTPTAMKWLAPLSPILGWNGGDEFKTTEMSTRHGHIQTCTDWCSNLPILMAGSEKVTQPKVVPFDPRSIDWNDQRSAVSFLSSDGDNVQWFQGSFFRSGQAPYFWANPNRGTIPFGWSCCFSNLAQLCPGAIDYALASRSPNDSFVEWGGGYYYPDLFGMDRPNRWELLAEQSRRTWELMKRNGTQMIGFNVSTYDSPDALKAYQVFASQADGLLAILVFQYSRYEEGAGNTFWVKDRYGIELPVITARYSIWEHQNGRDRAGTPAKVAREIQQTVNEGSNDELPRYDWVICHVWSYFKPSTSDNENDENVPQDSAIAEGGVRGYSPAVWCANRVPAEVRVASPEELMWRIRMKHNPEQTGKLLGDIK